MTTKFEIINLLKTRDVAVARALVVLNERQTADEQVAEATKYNNGRGFTAADARVGTSMAQFYEKRGFLTPKQISYWRRLRKDGKMRIEIYATQLLEIANEKAAAMQRKLALPHDDIGNLMEEKMVVEEMYDAAVARDDDEEAERLGNRLIQIAEAVEEIKRCQFKMQRDMA